MTITTARTLTMTLGALSLVATASAEPAAWALVLIGGSVALVMMWMALGDASAAAPVVTLIAIASLFMFTDDRIAIGPLVACVLALAAGELLWSLQAESDQGAVTIRPVNLTRSAASSSLVASGVIVVVMVLSRLPNHRTLSVAAVIALAGLAAIAHRRRSTIDDVPLPPPVQH